jgi:hypothetical protein
MLAKSLETVGELTIPIVDGSLPAGVVELSAPRALGGATSLAVRAMAAAHARDPRSWCAWIDPEQNLHAPGLAQRGVDLARLLVVRPERKDVQRIAIKTVQSGAFDVVAIDVDSVGEMGIRKRKDALFVRKLALGAEKSGAAVLLLVDSLSKKSEPWPVALRLELERSPDSLFVRVGKDRHGRLVLAKARIAMDLQDAG